MDKFDITIIITCFNGYRYMDKCLNSLENQTVKPCKVVIIDDCSTDNSYDLLKLYANKTKLNIEVIRNKDNLGPSKSREIGLKYVSSQYISFCDCDDWYANEFIETISNKVLNENVDLIIFDNYRCFENGKKIKKNITKNLIEKSKKQILVLYGMSLCRFVIKKDLINNISFPNIRHGEDGAIALQLIYKASNIVIIDKCLYYYFSRGNSLSKKILPNEYKNMIDAFEIIDNNICNDYKTEKEYLGIKYVIHASTMYAFKANLPNKAINEITNYFSTKYPNWIENKYINYMSKAKRIYIYSIYYKIYFIARFLSKVHSFLLNTNNI